MTLNETDVQFSPLRAQGPGGQNVNKVSNAVQLRFDIAASRLPEALKHKLLGWSDQRISAKQGVIVIKAQAHRSLEQNKAEALARLNALLAEAAHEDKPRRATRPTYGSKQRRLEGKAVRAGIKAGRGKVNL